MDPADILTEAADRLETLAKQATPGPWEVRHGAPAINGDTWTLRTKGKPGIVIAGRQYTFNADYDLITTFDPITAVLLAQVMRAEARNAAMSSTAYGYYDKEAAMLDLAQYILKE